MRRNRMVLLGVVATAAVAGSATLVLAGAGGGTFGDADFFGLQSVDERSTNSKQWEQIPGVGVGLSTTPQVVTISAEMKKGKARVRIVNVDTNTAVPPGPVQFTAQAANSFSFGIAENCPPSYALQWKRVGTQKAVASNVSVLRVDESGSCF
jgi:hypothetical protein